MKYNLNLESISIQKYKALLKTQNLLPGRRILLQNLDAHFLWFESNGMSHVAQVKKSLSNSQKIATIAGKSGIPEEYLLMLKREIGSLEQKPVHISAFPGVNPYLVNRLREDGIRNSKDYWEHHHSESDELFCLCDLVRINGVGPLAAKTFYEAGYQSVGHVAEADAARMLRKVSEVNDTRHYYKAKLGIKDMQFCIDFAKLIESIVG